MQKRQNPARPARPAALPAEGGLRSRVWLWAAPIFIFLSLTAQSRIFGVLAAVIFLALSVGRTPLAHFRARTAPLTFAVLLYGAVCLASGLWSDFGAAAAVETAKTLTALSVFGLVLARGDSPRRLLAWLDGGIAAVAFLCVDASSAGYLTRLFIRVMSWLGSEYDFSTMGYETGVRITGIYSNANVAAGVIAFGLIVSLYLVRTSDAPRRRLLACGALGIESLAFFLSFSMGAMAAFGLTCLVYLLAAGRGERLALFLLMLGCAVSAGICGAAAYSCLGRSGAIVWLPDLLALVCGAGIWLLDQRAGTRLRLRLEGRGRAVAAVCVGLAALCVLYVALALQVTGGVALRGGETLSRAVYLAPGEYSVQVQGAAVSATVYSQNEAELMMHTRDVLYEGGLSGASFTVPEDSRIVWVELSGSGEVERVSFSDGTALKLGYRLLPGFAANRLQGLRANQNFIQRLVFFRDGITLWKGSPLTGWGLAGVEGRLTSVQSFYYETKYIHNQFIQILDEAGVIGLAAFLGLLGSALWTLLRCRRRENGPLPAVFAAALTMMTAHSLTEVVWSTQMYQATVFLVLSALVLYDRQTAAAPEKRGGLFLPAALWALTAVFALLLCGNLLAGELFGRSNPTSYQETVQIMQRLDRLDAYDDESYKVNLMGAALQEGSATDRGLAEKCARELRSRNEFEACRDVAAYYDLPLKKLPELFDACEAGLDQEASNPDAWNAIFTFYRQIFAQLDDGNMADYLTGILHTGSKLETFNQGRMEQITLTDENRQFLDTVSSLEGKNGGDVYAALLPILGN